MLKKTVGNWVDGDRFFDRESDITALRENVSQGTHTLLVAQRRMGKTSLVRELLRRLKGSPGIETAFVDLEDARDPADAIVQLSLASRHLQSIPRRAGELKEAVFRRFRNIQLAAQHEEMRFQLRAEINSGTWKSKGDLLMRDLARGNGKVVLAIDELSVLVSRILKGRNAQMLPENIEAADEFLSWLRRNAQEHRGRLCLIVSGSVGITPILKQAGLSAAMNVFSAYKSILEVSQDAGAADVAFVLDVLVHDGYFIRCGEEFRFASGLLEDWQRSRKGLPITPLTAI